MNEVAGYNNNLQLFYNSNDVAKEYGLYSKQVVVPNPAGRPDIYLVFGVEPIKDDVNPVEIINRNSRNTTLFYPKDFAVSLSECNALLAWERISTYLAYAEFMCTLYDEFDTPLPKTIRTDELTELAKFHSHQNDPNFDVATRKQYADGIRDFFKNEKPKTKFKKEWQEFYRSELFDTDKSFAKNFLTFLKRGDPETELDVLLESSDNLKKVYVSEHRYKEFLETIKSRYPDVKFSASDKKVVDKGLIVDPKTKKRVVTPYGKSVTDEEYDKICEQRFAVEGFNCLDGLDTAYYEGRDIIYKASDENIIASVLNDISFRWAKCPSLEEMQSNGRLKVIDIPVNQMKNFYVHMQKYGVPFCIDNDANRKPNFEVLHVLYNATDHDTVMKLVTGLALATMSMAHISIDPGASFEVDINKVDNLIKSAENKAGIANNVKCDSRSCMKPTSKEFDI